MIRSTRLRHLQNVLLQRFTIICLITGLVGVCILPVINYKGGQSWNNEIRNYSVKVFKKNYLSSDNRSNFVVAFNAFMKLKQCCGVISNRDFFTDNFTMSEYTPQACSYVDYVVDGCYRKQFEHTMSLDEITLGFFIFVVMVLLINGVLG